MTVKFCIKYWRTLKINQKRRKNVETIQNKRVKLGNDEYNSTPDIQSAISSQKNLKKTV